jgi:hypothetical protein
MIDVDVVQADGLLAQPYLARSGLPDLNLFPVQDFRPTGLVNPDCMNHGSRMRTRESKEKPRRGGAGRGRSLP